MDLEIPNGYRVGPWEVREPLASGAFGSVYAARLAAPPGKPAGDVPDGLPQDAALKFLPTGTRTPRQLRHLRELADREVELLKKLRHPRLVRMHQVLTVDDPGSPELDGATVLVLERAEGSLDTLLDRRPAPVPARLLAEVCEGLAQLHRAGWVHGDLKPANVLLVPDGDSGTGSVRLADFNLAVELEGTHGYSPAFATPDYTPPELAWAEFGERGHQIRPTADIWAFGVLAHLALTGTMPFPGGTPSARRDAAVRYARGVEELRLSPELPAEWRPIVTDCLARTHAERARHDTVSLLRRVEAAAGTEPSPRLPRLRPRRRVPRPLFAAGAAALAVTVTVGLLTALREDPSDHVGYDRCARGNVCFFPEPDGQGDMCAWYGNDADWNEGDLTCYWTKTRPVRSVFNNGKGVEDGETFVDVNWFGEIDFRKPLGCVENGRRMNVDGDVLTNSHQWAVSC
ncbi:protein kinase [Streptomyces durbertensis]|uniref:Protein kinase n=1 Tax=Streptomyces durbertensis TaxID=2448886 RepID=A0ABR6EA17_9ACTN|nr:serine/threonine-protein kinase [Streptomyces durbertensis]MBB1242176.1 protein kinase [Streptomyces durbertensis]